MKEFRTLKVLDLFQRFFVKMGVDYPIMRKLLQVKLTMDGRRVPAIFSQSTKKQNSETNDHNNFIKSLWLYVLMGAIMIPLLLIGQNYMFQMGFIFGILMFLIMTSMISDFSTVLLDIRDRNIIGSKPINRKTISMAKMIHIIVYLFFLTGSLSIAPLITALLKNGILFFLLFLLEIILLDVLIVVMTGLVYLLILRFFDGEKLKDIINYVQIALSITITVGYQMVGRSFDMMKLNFEFHAHWWQVFVIPLWFGAPFEWLLHRQNDAPFIIFSILALIVPFIAIKIYSNLMPTFERYLQKLANNSITNEKGNGWLLKLIAKIICNSRDERTFFRFAIYMMGNEREFKLKVYPALGFSIIFPFIFIFNEIRDRGLSGMASSNWYLSIYMCAMMIPTVMMMLKYSAKYKGAWIYRTVPFHNAAPIFKGTIKAFIVRLFLPIYVIESLLFTLLFGTRIIPHLIIVFLSILLYTIICFRALRKALPFSESFDAIQQNEAWVVLPLLLLITIFGGIHYLATLFNGGLYGLMAILLAVNFIVWRKGFNISWQSLSGNSNV
jgi:ABC-2 type transport system permease protein